MLNYFRIAAAVAVFAILWSLPDSEAAPAVKKDESQEWPTIKGRIAFKGANIPKREVILAARKRDCCRNGDLYSEEWIVNATNRGIKDTVIWLAPDIKDRKAAFPRESIHPKLLKEKVSDVKMLIMDCHFIPNVLAVREGASIEFTNLQQEAATHAVKMYPKANPDFVQLILIGEARKTEALKKEPSAIPVSCALHSWMHAYIRVFDHPYFAVTDSDGNFEIKLAPKGKFRLYIWHPANGWKDGIEGKFGQQIEIVPGTNDLGDIQVKKND